MRFRSRCGSDASSGRCVASLLAAMVAEFLGTMFIVFFGCGCALNLVTGTDLVQISFGFGLVVFCGVVFAGPVSGAHLNPAVTLGLALVRRVRIFRAAMYVVAQVLGGIVGAYILLLVTPEPKRATLGANALYKDPICIDAVVDDNTGQDYDYDNSASEDNSTDGATATSTVICPGDVTPGQGFGVEFIATFLLVMVVLAVTDKRNALKGNMPPAAAAVGMAVAVAHLLSVPYTGCGINPARSIGPAVASGATQDLGVVYVVAPMAAAIVAAAVHSALGRMCDGCKGSADVTVCGGESGRVGNAGGGVPTTEVETIKMVDK